MVKLKNSAKR